MLMTKKEIDMRLNQSRISENHWTHFDIPKQNALQQGFLNFFWSGDPLNVKIDGILGLFEQINTFF